LSKKPRSSTINFVGRPAPSRSTSTPREASRASASPFGGCCRGHPPAFRGTSRTPPWVDHGKRGDPRLARRRGSRAVGTPMTDSSCQRRVSPRHVGQAHREEKFWEDTGGVDRRPVALKQVGPAASATSRRRAHVTGGAKYVGRYLGTAHGRTWAHAWPVMSPHAHARVPRPSPSSNTRAMPGFFLAVLTARRRARRETTWARCGNDEPDVFPRRHCSTDTPFRVGRLPRGGGKRRAPHRPGGGGGVRAASGDPYRSREALAAASFLTDSRAHEPRRGPTLALLAAPHALEGELFRQRARSISTSRRRPRSRTWTRTTASFVHSSTQHPSENTGGGRARARHGPAHRVGGAVPAHGRAPSVARENAGQPVGRGRCVGLHARETPRAGAPHARYQDHGDDGASAIPFLRALPYRLFDADGKTARDIKLELYSDGGLQLGPVEAPVLFSRHVPRPTTATSCPTFEILGRVLSHPPRLEHPPFAASVARRA